MSKSYFPFSLRVSPESMKAWKAAAAASRGGISLSRWARAILDAAAGASALPPQELAAIHKQLELEAEQGAKVRDGDW